MRYTRFFLLAAGLLILTGCQHEDRATNTNSSAVDETVQVVTTTYPLQEFTQHVGGTLVTVTNLTVGVEPHDFEPTPQTVQTVAKADVLIMNGAGVDYWADALAEQANATVVMADSITPAQTGEGPDPHFWMDVLQAQTMVAVIRDELIAIDSAHTDAYTVNAAAYIAELQKLDVEFQTGLATCERYDIIVSHDAFGYMGNRYHITTHAIAGLSPEQEPTPQKIAELSDLARSTGTTHIFFESLVSPELAETVADEAGAEILVLNPIEGFTADEQAQGENYITAMQENLTNLRTALACQ
jgi:zinc transport system substrate-binding protein